jgi:hypothetical protein
MLHYHSRPSRRKSAIGLPLASLSCVGLPLFEYADTQNRQPHSVRWLQRHHGLPTHLARVTAEQLGLSLEVCE